MTTVMDETMQDADGGTPAPYGRACTNCAKAKCRCIYRSEVGDCERCHRLKKECVPSVSVRRRNGRRILGSRTAQLEEKLEDLVTLLRNQAGRVPNDEDVVANLGITTPSPSSHSTGHSQAVDSPQASRGVPENPTPAVFTPDQLSAPPRRCQPSADALLSEVFDHKQTATPPFMPQVSKLPSVAEADERLETFRTHMLHFLPFAYIHPFTTSTELREEKPFFWFTIMTVACKKTSEQGAMSASIRHYLALKIVGECEKSLDLLLGLLVFIGWSHFHKKDKPHLTVMGSLLNSLVCDLSLNKPPGELHPLLCFRGSPYELSKPAPTKPKTLEERRTMLACFYTLSVLSCDLRKLDPFDWSPYMDECLEIVDSQAEWTGDKALVHMVKLQLLIDRINNNPSYARDGAIPTLYVHALRSQLQKIKSNIPPEVEQWHPIIHMSLFADLIINESVLLKSPAATSNPDFSRFEVLEGALNIMTTWFEKFFAIPKDRYIGMSFAFWCQMVHCLMTLAILTTRDDPAWSRAAVRQKLDIFDICDRLGQGLQEVADKRRLLGNSDDDDMFSKSQRIIKVMKETWQAEMRAADQSANPSGVSAGLVPSEPREPPGFVDGVTTGPLAMPMSQFLGEEAWLTDIFNVSWE